MGPSGSGKTTLLNAIAHRLTNSKTRVSGRFELNQQAATQKQFRKISRFVEAEDVLIGALTVRETLYFAARLGLGKQVSRTEREELIEEMLQVFGLKEQAETIVGTMMKRGLSTGQKRRLSVAAQMIAAPQILFLDEPTSGLDSAASFKVMNYVRAAAKAHNLLVICSIHQPSSTTFDLFDKVLLLSGGKTCYSGRVEDMRTHWKEIGQPIPLYVNPAEFALDLVNIDFESDGESAKYNVAKIQSSWEAIELDRLADEPHSPTGETKSLVLEEVVRETVPNSALNLLIVVLHRNWIKSRRDFMVYAARMILYIGLAILIGTVWLRLPANQMSIDAYSRCILFSSAFSSFMAVVYVPAFLEDYFVFTKDRSNGSYGTAIFGLANFLTGLPFLFMVSLIPASISYWMVNFRPDASAFMVWVAWSYLNILGAESLVVLASAIFPNFLGALSLFAMVNEIWMASNGYMVPLEQLNAFYRYLYYINYQGYVYRGYARNEFQRSYECAGCECRIPTTAADKCSILGADVVKFLGLEEASQGFLVGSMLAIIVIFRVLAWAVMYFRKR
jgi:ABC-type multidrug transport system ATPase subunit